MPFAIPRAPRLALDRSSRVYDRSGHLNVSDNVFTCAGVSAYMGAEVADWDSLGLSPSKVYYLLRPADELRRAAPTLAGKPVLARHVEATADDHPHDDVVGAVGSDITFDGQVVRGSITVWDGAAIAGIERDECRSLSCAYYYDADMRSGVFNGQSYDGVMRNLSFNHLAICITPRVAGAMINDSLQEELPVSMQDFAPLLEFLKSQLDADGMEAVDSYLQSLCDPDSVQAQKGNQANDRNRRVAGDSRIYTPLGQRRYIAPNAGQISTRQAMFPNGDRLRSVYR